MLRGELVEVFLPVAGAVAAEFEKVAPAENPGRMHVVENEAHRVVSDRLDLEDLHVPLAGHGLALGGRMPLHLGTWTSDPQVLGIEREILAAVEGNAERLAVLV